MNESVARYARRKSLFHRDPPAPSGTGVDTVLPYLQGPIAQKVVMQNPGRETSWIPPEKPTESPWHSKWVVSSRHSADGNSYDKGDPIPFEEAVRQGILEEEARNAPVATVNRCSRCQGRGTYSKSKPRNHPDPHPNCIFCAACPRCGGSGEEPG